MRIIIYCPCGEGEPHFDHYECNLCHKHLPEVEHPDWNYCPFCGCALYEGEGSC